MENLEYGYEPNKNYGNHHQHVRNKISSSFKKGYDDLNTKIKVLMDEANKIQKGRQGYLKDKKSKQDITSLCGNIYQDFKEMKADYESKNLNQRKYFASLNTLKTMIDVLPSIDGNALHEWEIIAECHKQGVIK